MMNAIQTFNHPEFGSVRTILLDEVPWFVGKDVATTLGYHNASKALADHVDGEDKLNNESLSSLGQRGGWLINESGLYSLIFSSKLPAAKKFKRWVTSEVLPAIRKTGRYEKGLSATQLNEDYLKAAKALAECPEDRLHYVAAVLRQGGFEVPQIPVKIPKSTPTICYGRNRFGGMSEEERDRMQYETLLQYPQFIPEHPEAIEKHPELADFIPGAKKDNRPLPLRKSVSREGYTIGFDRKKMKRLMEKRGMKHQDLAEKSGICISSVRSYLAGRCMPGTINRNRLCDALNVEHGYFDM